MVDMHNHILFEVDDGPKTIEGSMELIKEAVSKGVTHIILTPHLIKSNRNLKPHKSLGNFQILKEAVDKESINVQLYLGNEVYIDPLEYKSIFIEDKFYTLAGSKYILIEFNVKNPPSSIGEICYEVTMNGYIPIISHVERYEILHNNREMLKDILKTGALLQVNASNILNKETKEKTEFAHYLLKNELVNFVASDVHNNTDRKFYLDEAYAAVCNNYSIAYAEKIFKLNQLNIINSACQTVPTSGYPRV